MANCLFMFLTSISCMKTTNSPDVSENIRFQRFRTLKGEEMEVRGRRFALIDQHQNIRYLIWVRDHGRVIRIYP